MVYILGLTLKEDYPTDILNKLDIPTSLNLSIIKTNDTKIGIICTKEPEKYIVRQLSGLIKRSPDFYPYFTDDFGLHPL